MSRLVPAVLLALVALGCDAFRYHPYAVPQDESLRGLTRKNLEKLAQIEPTDTFSFAVIGDTQRWFDETRDAVRDINRRDDVAFAVVVGDLTEYGSNREYVWLTKILKALRVPVLTVVGNHDLLGNGGAIYEAMYGPRNYAFLFGRTRFVMLDSNSREYLFDGRVPDLDWLERELMAEPTWDRAVVISHVPPDHPDSDQRMLEGYTGLLARDGRVPLSLHGHEHRYRDEEIAGDGVRYLVAPAMQDRIWLRVTVGPGGVEVEQVRF